MQFPEQKISELDYIPARIVEGKDWFVSFYAFNPVIGKLNRKKIHLNRIKSISQRREMGRRMCIKINDQLKRGWNPFIQEEASKAYHKLTDVIETYLTIAKKEFEENTMRSYRSFSDFLKRYLKEVLKDEDIFVYKFTDHQASDLMLHINSQEKLSIRTYNNYLIFYKTLFNWMVRFNYKKSNPFGNIPKKQVPKTKNRIPVSASIRGDLKPYLLKEKSTSNWWR